MGGGGGGEWAAGGRLNPQLRLFGLVMSPKSASQELAIMHIVSCVQLMEHKTTKQNNL